MSLETLERSPPPFFKQGPSALSRLVFFSALALLLMVTDARLRIVQPVRAAIATVLYPAQWLALQPVQWVEVSLRYLADVKTAQITAENAERQLAAQSVRAGQVEYLERENQRLRDLLQLRRRLPVPGTAAQVLYDATDPYSRRVVLSKGQLQGIADGSPVMDGSGVLGQITRVYPFVSEATLLVDRDQVIPIMFVRTGLRGVAYGNPSPHGGILEVRYISESDDVKAGDLVVTSGVDDVYPPGLPVATVTRVERRNDSSFARILCQPLAQLGSVTHVMVLKPMKALQEVASAASAAEGAVASAPLRSALARDSEVVREARP